MYALFFCVQTPAQVVYSPTHLPLKHMHPSQLWSFFSTPTPLWKSQIDSPLIGIVFPSLGVFQFQGIRIFICKYRVFVPCLVSLVCRFTSLVYNEKSCMAKFSRFIFYINLFRFDGLNTSDVFLFLICCVRYRLQISFLISKFILYPRNHQKTCGFLRISGATEVD